MNADHPVRGSNFHADSQIEEIKQLKARYFRAMDTKDRELMSQVFAEDALFNMGGGANPNPEPNQTRIVTGSPAIVEALMTGLDKRFISVHQGFCHEVEILSPTEAHGVIGLEDRVVMIENGETVSGLHGWGHYHERYVKVDGQWKIHRSKVTRLRIDGFGPWFEGLRRRAFPTPATQQM